MVLCTHLVLVGRVREASCGLSPILMAMFLQSLAAGLVSAIFICHYSEPVGVSSQRVGEMGC